MSFPPTRERGRESEREKTNYQFDQRFCLFLLKDRERGRERESQRERVRERERERVREREKKQTISLT